MRRLFVPFTVITLAAYASAASTQERLELDWEAVAAKIVERMALESGERVLLVAHPEMFRDLVIPLRLAVQRTGATDLGVVPVIPRGERPDPGAAGNTRRAYVEMFGLVDAAIMLPGATPAHSAYWAMQEILHAGRGRTVHFHWLENGSAFAIPGQPLPSTATIDTLYQRALLETNYEALATVQRRFEAAMRNGEVRVTTPAGTDLRLRIGTRPVTVQDGDASPQRAAGARVLIDREIELPAGAVRVAPLEESVNGTIAFPPSQWNGRPVYGLRLRFERGRVTDVSAAEGVEHVHAEMRVAGPAGNAFRQFALGFNPLLAVPDDNPWIPYYGYGAGVVRLSLGDNSELGGTVTGGYVRWNFFTDATVTVGEDVWVRDGRLVYPVQPTRPDGVRREANER